MSYLKEAESEPWRFDFFAALRRIERSFPDKPRIGHAATRRDELVQLGQDPFLDFPASNLQSVRRRQDGRLELRVKFLGLLGPQGALPLPTTEEAYHWQLARDDAFPRFLDLLNHRFLQLFFRAWADARPIAQHDRPREDRFGTYVGSSFGLGSAIFRDLDTVPDAAKLAFAGLLGAKARSASRLRGLIRGLFKVEVEVDQFVGSRLELHRSDQTRLGSRLSTLGVDALVGCTCFSVQDKIRIRIFTASFEAYERFLPPGDLFRPLADLVAFYVGQELDWDVELAIPAGAVRPVALGRSGRLGWTGWVAPNWTAADAYRRDARFSAARWDAEGPKQAA